MVVLSFGIRLVVVLPTVFFLFSQLLRYALKARTKEMVSQGKFVGVQGTFSLGILPRYLGELSTREFRFEFFIDSTILSIANGLILSFELARFEYGVVALILGVAISVAGFVATETNSKVALSWLAFLLILLFVSEVTYFSFFGVTLMAFGFELLPRHFFFIPSLVSLALILVLGVIVPRIQKTTARSQP